MVETRLVEEAAKIYSGIIDEAKKGSVFEGYSKVFELLGYKGSALEVLSKSYFDFMDIFVDGSKKDSIEFSGNPNLMGSIKCPYETPSMAYSVLSAIFNCYPTVSPTVELIEDNERFNVYLAFDGNVEELHNEISSAKEKVRSIRDDVIISI